MSASLDITKHLHEAIRQGQPEMVALYLKNGAQLTQYGSSNKTAIGALESFFLATENREKSCAIAEEIINHINKKNFTNPCDEIEIGRLIMLLLRVKRSDLVNKCLHPNTSFIWYDDSKHSHSTFDYLVEAKQGALVEKILTITFNSTDLNSANSFDKVIESALTAAGKAQDVSLADKILSLNKQFLEQLAAAKEESASAPQDASSPHVKLSMFNPEEELPSSAPSFPEQTEQLNP